MSYAYEKGAFSTIPLRWDERAGTLTIGPRVGSFPGMLAQREMRVVFVSKRAPIGHSAAPATARSVPYDGNAVVVRGRP